MISHFFTRPFSFIYLITPLSYSHLNFLLFFNSSSNFFKLHRYMFAIYSAIRPFAMIIIIYFYLFVCIEYLLLLNMIIMLLLYLIMINIFIIHFHFNIVVMMLLLLYCFLNCILIIKIDNSFTIFFYGGFLLIFIIIIFMNWFILNMINFYLSIMRYFIQEVHLRTCLISKILFVNSSNLFLCFISSGRVVTPSKRNHYAIITQLLCHLPKSRL